MNTNRYMILQSMNKNKKQGYMERECATERKGCLLPLCLQQQEE